jgi:nitroimidazol reductase NimA-like FMN-containing flavoprotein (pyridoxamine 5'-phosphate oxidase superfamily)
LKIWQEISKRDPDMRDIRRKEKEIKDKKEMTEILKEARYIAIAMCKDDTPYLVTLNHGYDPENVCIYFHCAQEGKKIDFLRSNNSIWGCALVDKGYVKGACDHLYKTVHFKGTVSFLEDTEEKRKALICMIKQLEPEPDRVIEKQITSESLSKVKIGKININQMTGKKSEKLIIST